MIPDNAVGRHTREFRPTPRLRCNAPGRGACVRQFKRWLARELSRLGAADWLVAEALGVCEATVRRWRRRQEGSGK